MAGKGGGVMEQTAIKALAKAQTEMGKALKNAKNPHLKSNYADLGSVMEACFEALHKNGFAIMQPGGADEYGPYVETVFAHEEGHTFRSRVYLVIGKQDMQGVGSAITYARRYGLLGMAGLAPEDDDGEATKRAPVQRQEPAAGVSDLPPFDPAAARDRIKAAILKADSFARLKEVWTKEADVLAEIKDAKPAMFAELDGAKNKRKAEIDPASQSPDIEGKAA